MDLKPSQVLGMQLTTSTNKQPNTSHNKAKQTSYTPTFKDFIDDLMMEQREQM